MAKVISVLSGKGGTGKTLFAVNIGTELALEGNRVLIMDTNFHARGVDIALGLEDRVIYDMVDIINGDCRIKQALVKSRSNPGLFILEPPILGKSRGISLIELGVLLERLKKDFDYIIIDTSSGSAIVAEGIALKSDMIMVVTTQDMISIRAGQNLIAGLKARGIRDIKMVVNQVKLKLTDKGYLTDVEEIAEISGADVCGVIPYDDSMHVAFNNSRAIVTIPESTAGAHLKRVIQRFIGNDE